jgi:hypothetical protein
MPCHMMCYNLLERVSHAVDCEWLCMCYTMAMRQQINIGGHEDSPSATPSNTVPDTPGAVELRASA